MATRGPASIKTALPVTLAKSFHVLWVGTQIGRKIVNASDKASFIKDFKKRSLRLFSTLLLAYFFD